MALTILQTLLIKLSFILLGIAVCGLGLFFAYKFRKIGKILIGLILFALGFLLLMVTLGILIPFR